MANRKPIRRDVQTRILIGSRRRCCLCYFWDGHKQQTPGQIAHIDRDSSNADEDNLAYLCLDHHNQYDRKEGLCKDITPDELRHAKQFLVRSFDGASEPELLITITLDGISGDNSVDVPRIVRLIEEVVRSNGELTIKATRPGSVRITLGLNPTETQRLVEAVERGTFEGTGIRDLAIEHVDERLILRDTRLGCSEVSDLRLSIAASNVRKIEESLCGFLTRFGGRAKSLITQFTTEWEPVLERATYRAGRALASGEIPGVGVEKWFLQFVYLEAIAAVLGTQRSSNQSTGRRG